MTCMWSLKELKWTGWNTTSKCTGKMYSSHKIKDKGNKRNFLCNLSNNNNTAIYITATKKPWFEHFCNKARFSSFYLCATLLSAHFSFPFCSVYHWTSSWATSELWSSSVWHSIWEQYALLGHPPPRLNKFSVNNISLRCNWLPHCHGSPCFMCRHTTERLICFNCTFTSVI